MITQFILVVRLFTGLLPQGPAGFWVSETTDPCLWRDVRTAFRQELLPDDPAKTAPYVALKYKYVARIARVSDVCLVVVGQREDASDRSGDDYFIAFSYDLVTHKRIPITNHGFTRWQFVTWAYFAPETPEVVFRYQTCSDCEAVYLLASFFLDAASRTWTIRNWPEDGESILIGSDWTVGANINSHAVCLFRAADFSGDGKADIAIWCRTFFDEPSRKMQESVRCTPLPTANRRSGIPTLFKLARLSALYVGVKRRMRFAEGNHEDTRM